MKLKDLLLELTGPKLIPRAIGKERNESYKCENKKDFSEAITKISGGKPIFIAAILDIKGKIAYIVERKSFHEDMASRWGIPYDEKSNNFIILTATYNPERGSIKVDDASYTQASIIKHLNKENNGWLKSVFNP